MIEKINDELEKINRLVNKLYQNDIVSIASQLDQEFLCVNQMMLAFIKDSHRYKEYGMEIPEEVLIGQVKNFMDAYKRKDVLMLADVLKYEISEGLVYYREVLKAIDGE